MGESWEDAVNAVLKAMAEEIAGAAPRGWKRAELHGYATGPDGAGHRGFWFEPYELNEVGSNDIDVFDGMRELHTLMEATDQLTIELQLDARGRYRAVLSERLDRSYDRGFRYLFDPEAAPPEPEALPVDPDLPEAGDPDEAVSLLRDYLRRVGEILSSENGGGEVDLPLPLPESDRLEIEADLEVALPRDLRALYAFADGDGGRGLLHGYPWFGLEMLAEFADPSERWWVPRGWRRFVFQPFVNEFGPALTIQRHNDHRAWIPFATDLTGDYLAVDMAPGPRGRPGQVILVGRNRDDGPTYVADSVTSLLRLQVNALAAGAFEYGEDGLWIKAGDLEQHNRHYGETCRLEVTGPDAAPIRGMHPEIRELTVGNAPWVDFGPVRGAPALWRITMTNCPGADLRPLLDAPVEVLDLSLDRIDLSGLAGHPTLQRVILHSESPVDLRPLLSCPRLYALDLTDVTASDIAVLGGFTGLQHVKMQRPQWEDLWAAKAIPASLAIAELAEEPLRERKWYWSFDNAYKTPRRPTLKDAVEWAENLAGDDADIWAFKGRFTASDH